MERLIDDNLLKKGIKKWLKPSKPDEDEYISITDALVSTLQEIEAQPTAYDPEKVVEQLEDYGNEEMHYYKGTPYEKCIEVCIGKAIEIVKGGGVDAF